MEIVFDKVSFKINASTPLEKTVLNDISFAIEGSGIYSFVGASNSGKTTIGALISTAIIPSKGKVKISSYISDGRKRGLKTIRSKIGFVNKNPYDMFFNKTVYKELSFGIEEFKYKTKSIETRVKDALKLVGLTEEYLDKDPHSLNLRDAKKLALACILIYNPKIIVLDEITNGLSKYDKKELVRLLKTLKNKYGKMIILLSKDTSFCYEVTDYVYLMNYTKIVKSGKKNILEDEKLLLDNNLEVPQIVSFVNACNKKGHNISYYTNILDLIKGVYRDVY